MSRNLTYVAPSLRASRDRVSAGCVQGSGASSSAFHLVSGYCSTGTSPDSTVSACFAGAADSSDSYEWNCVSGDNVTFPMPGSCTAGNSFYSVGAACGSGGNNLPSACTTGGIK
jgi:hypothetical protein